VWIQASDVKFKFLEFTFEEFAGVPLDDFE
jgi:hypothetical protein